LIYEKLGRYGEAVREADEVVRLSPRDRDSRFYAALNGAAYYRALAGQELAKAMDDAQLAVELIREAIRIYSSNDQPDAITRLILYELRASLAATLDTRGLLHYERGDLDAALVDLDDAIDGQLRSIHRCRGLILTCDALVRDEFAASLGPMVEGLGEMYYHRGLVLKKLSRPREALRDFQRAAASGFDARTGHWGVGVDMPPAAKQ
jgi:tetratricopeptide (TPR) repeat protein